jgi:hypothetical protein
MDQNGGILIMSQKELERSQIIRKIFDKEINQQEAAEYLGISDRQVRRIVKRVRKEGDRGLLHQLRGRVGNRRISQGLKRRVVSIYRRVYEGFGPTLASEKLLERERIKVNDETLRLWLIEEGLWRPRRRRELKRRSWRARKEHVGEMIQMDGSHHDWLEGRGPKMVLMGYVDDATGRLYGKFYEYEGTQPAMDSLRGYVKKYGLPKSIYLDKHATYRTNKKERYKEWPFRDKEELTQFARACRQLGIELKFAHSPQAKGRVERVFGTLQDRLVKELRLAKVRTLTEANRVLGRYLPVFNKRFTVAARQSGDMHRPTIKVNVPEVLSIQTEHVLRNDRTLVHEKQWYQVLNRTRVQKVVVHEYLNGRIEIRSGKNRFKHKPINNRPERIQQKRKVKPRKRYSPPRDSYWHSGFKLPGSLKN